MVLQSHAGFLDCRDSFLFDKIHSFLLAIFILFIHKHIYNRNTDKIKKTKTEMHKTVISCKATVTSEIKLKEEQLQN